MDSRKKRKVCSDSAQLEHAQDANTCVEINQDMDGSLPSENISIGMTLVLQVHQNSRTILAMFALVMFVYHISKMYLHIQ